MFKNIVLFLSLIILSSVALADSNSQVPDSDMMARSQYGYSTRDRSDNYGIWDRVKDQFTGRNSYDNNYRQQYRGGQNYRNNYDSNRYSDRYSNNRYRNRGR